MSISDKLNKLTNDDLQTVWDSLSTGYNPFDELEPGISMGDWAESVYVEMNTRGLSTMTEKMKYQYDNLDAIRYIRSLPSDPELKIVKPEAPKTNLLFDNDRKFGLEELKAILSEAAPKTGVVVEEFDQIGQSFGRMVDNINYGWPQPYINVEKKPKVKKQFLVTVTIEKATLAVSTHIQEVENYDKVAIDIMRHNPDPGFQTFIPTACVGVWLPSIIMLDGEKHITFNMPYFQLETSDD